MTQPSGQQVAVATGVLRTEAGQWDAQSATMSGLSAKVAAMELGRVEAGLFQVMVSSYNEIVSVVQARCQEAGAAMTEVGATLRTVADTYDAEDLNSAHRIGKIY
jgi:hypothetical protein